MDILTPKGQETLRQEREAIQLFLAEYPAFQFVETPKDKPADIDGFVYRDGALISGVEVKCRMMTYADLVGRFANMWLVTYDKIERGISVCRSLGIDFRGFLYLVPDRALVIVKLWDVNTNAMAAMELEETKTQATVNGGSIVRLNAYIDMQDAKIVCAQD